MSHSHAAFWALAGWLAMPCMAQQMQGIRVHMHGGDGYAADGLLFVPAGTSPFPAIILVPDERGLTKRVIDSAARLAGAGFVAVAVDLNRGLSPETAVHSARQDARDLDAALAFIKAQSNVGRGLGALGWGSGGLAALRLAAASDLAAVAIDDTAPPRSATPDLGNHHAAILASFAGGGESGRLTGRFVARLHTATATIDAKTYPGAQSGFDDPDDA